MQNTKLKKQQIRNPHRDLSIIVTIPASNEPEIIHTLESLIRCTLPAGAVEVLVLLNSSAESPQEVIDNNRRSAQEIDTFSSKQTSESFRIMALCRENIPEKYFGAGYARKIAMDLAEKRFRDIGRPEGIILSLDADTLCEKNYLLEVENYFRDHPRLQACSIYFEHPLEGSGFPQEVYEGITQYELHLRYYIEGLRYAGHPHAYHTIGSCFAVRAGTYAAQGGMNRRKAGEDFYFLHKIIPLGHFGEINTTCLIPSPRPSRRVPFGTGPVIDKFLRGEISELQSYRPEVFTDLKILVDSIPSLYRAGEAQVREMMDGMPASVREFLEPGLYERLEEINRNSSDRAAFRKRFFKWFGIFRVLKFINHAHRQQYSMQPVIRSAYDFLLNTHPDFKGGSGAFKMLDYLRRLQRSGIE